MMWSKEGRDLVLDHDSSDWRKVDGSDGKILATLKEKEDWSDTEFEDLYTDEEEAGELKQFNIKILEPTSWKFNNIPILELELKDYWNKPELFYFQKNKAYRNNLYLFPIVVDKDKKEIQTFPKSLDGYAVEVEKICPCMRSDPYGVYAIADGKVSFVHENGTGKTEKTKKSSYGNYVVIKHEDETQSMYAHLSNYTVKKGDEVKGGQQIGVMGASGYGRQDFWSKHLHISYFPADFSETEIDPKWLAENQNWKNKVKNPLNLIKEKGNSYPANIGVSGQFNSDDKAYTTNKYYHEGIDFGKALLPNWQFGIAGEIITNGAVSNYPMEAPFTNVDHADFPFKKSEEDK